MTIRYLADVAFPARDRSLGAVLRDVSEPESGPHADNLMSNEDSYPRVVDQLVRLAPKGSVYLGVGPDQNLTYAAHIDPTLAFVADYRRRNALVHLLHKAILMLSADRVGYLSRFLARTPATVKAGPLSAEDLVAVFKEAPLDRALLDRQVREVAQVLRPYQILTPAEFDEIATLQRRLAGPGLNARFLALPMYPTLGSFLVARDRSGWPAHFLSDDRPYATLRAIQLGDRLVPIVANVVGGRAMPALGRWLKDRSMRVGVLYISDVEYFLIKGGTFGAFLENLKALPWADGAVVIRTSTRPLRHLGRVQGDSSTTVIRPIESLLRPHPEGWPRSQEDLFQNP